MSFRSNLSSLLSIILMLLALSPFTEAKKPVGQRQLEMIPEETEASYRLGNMRIAQESGVPRALYRIDYPVTPDSPLNMARQYLRDHAELLQLPADLAILRHTVTRETPGGFHVRFQQYAGEYPVYRSDLVVNLNRHNRVTFVMNSYQPAAALPPAAQRIGITEAAQIAKAYLGVRGSINHEAQETVLYAMGSQNRLAHRITIVPAEDTFGDWEILVDAISGEIFRVEDRACYHGPQTPTNGSGWVFDPDPLTHARAVYQSGGQFGDNNDNDTDSLLAHIVERPLLDIDFSGGQYHLDGPYANIEDFESPFFGQFSRPDSLWHFTRNPSEFEAANVYFHIDQSMRYINETLGFNLMPFQYTGGVRVDPHGLSGADNSHYIPSTGQVAWGEGGVDDSEDADVILHELGHGLHDWLTNGSLSQVNGLSEGCGDYWANSYNRATGQWTPVDPQYYWVFQWDGHNEFWAGRVTNYTATYPGGLTGSIHTDGQMWASTLMQIYEEIGRTATDSNFLEALSMTNGGTNQEDAAQAFIQADIDLFGGANLSVIEFYFTQRGYNITIPLPLPLAPANFNVYSDYTTPTSMQLNWNDPILFNTGDTLQPEQFTIEIERDGAPMVSIPGGSEQFADTGLVDGQEYRYKIFARVNTTGMVSPEVEYAWIAGGSPVPAAPASFSLSGNELSVKIYWESPAVNVDGTPMDDYAGINLYQNGTLVETFTRSSADTGRADTALYDLPVAGFYDWHITVIDNEDPQNESEPTQPLGTPLALPLLEEFAVPGEPNPGLWINSNTDINDRAADPPSGDYALNLNGKPDGEDWVDLKPLDLSGLESGGVTLRYYYQPQGNGNEPEPEDSLRVYLKNDLGEWVRVRSYEGGPVHPFTLEEIDLASAPAGNGSYFHGQFQVRFHSTGGAGFFPNDDWFIDDVSLTLNPLAVEEDIAGQPLTLDLGQNYPNPFNPATVIGYQLSVVSDVKLTVYNLLGEKVAALIDARQNAGKYQVQWNGRDRQGRQVSSGVYLYRLEAGTFVQTRKMILLR